MSFSVTHSLKVSFFVLILYSKKIFVSRYVKFVENGFLFVSLPPLATSVIETDFALPAPSSTLGDQVCGKHRDVTKKNINNRRQSLDGLGALWNNFSKKEPRKIPNLGILLIK